MNGFLLQKDMETVFPFYVDIYHSQYDTPDTYNEAVMDFNLKYYGALAMYIDQTPPSTWTSPPSMTAFSPPWTRT